MNQLLSFAGFEVRYHLRRPVTYVFAFALALFGFLAMTTEVVRFGGAGGKVLNNAPWLVSTAVMVFTLMGTIFTSAIAGTAVLRDFEYKTHELLFTTRLRKSAFVLGRFLGAYVVTVLVLACSALGLWLGSFMPWIDADKIGVAPPGTYVWPVLVYVVPTGLFVSALFFAVGVLTRSFVAVYIQGVVLFIGYSVANSLVSDIEQEQLAALLDPFGFNATNLINRYWTVAEKNSLLLPMDGALLLNRLLWIGIGALILLVAYRMFRMEAAPRGPKAAKAAKVEPELPAMRAPAVLPRVTPSVGPRVELARLVALVRLHYRSIVRERAFLALGAIAVLMTVVNAFYADLMYGTTVYPVTYAMVEVITGSALFFVIISALYAGELVWRERGFKCDQLVDATPTRSPLVFASKVVALLGVEATLCGALILTGIAVQAIKGYGHFELDVYLGYIYGVAFPGIALLTLLAFFIHVVTNQKLVANGLIIAYYMVMLVLSFWGVHDNLFRYSQFPDPVYSDMNHYGPSLGAWLWFMAYYFSFAGLLLAVARLFLVRGQVQGLRARLRLARARLTPRWLAATGGLLAVFLGLFAFIRHNTHDLNRFRDQDDEEELRAVYEREYKQYEHLPQPRIVAADVRVDLDPARGQGTFKGTLRLANKSGVAIPTVHVYLRDELTIRELRFDRPSEVEHDDKRMRYMIHRLAEPLAPGAELTLHFDLADQREGFSNGGRDTGIVANGSFVSSDGLAPSIGYNRGLELDNDDDRKQHGLPERERMPSIDDEAARANTYIASDSDWIDFRGTVCTDPDQIAIAPGYLQKEWTENGRRCFAYAMDSKILNFYSFLSARYEVRRDKWNDVDIEVYYHPGHEYNLDRMIDAVKKSLDYFTRNFSPYQHRQVRILEFPRYASFAQSFPNTIPYSEAIGFIARVRPGDPEDIDYPFYVTAHEVAHQWWAHQVIGANVQGATMLSESLSQYSALKVLEKEYGKDKMHKFLAYELKGYLGGRSNEKKKELPLMRNENQQYIHYQKGSLVWYALADYIGEDVLNAALARYIKQVGFQSAPFTTTKELVAILKEVTPAEYQYVIEDMFETITLYDNKVVSAEVTPEGSKYKVRFTVSARKLRASELGEETEVPVADFIDVAVFAAPGPQELDLGKPLFFERRKLVGGDNVIEVVVDEPPARVGIDPYNKLIDRAPKDNRMGV
ncbi:M1 family aminopeptidase [Nannocystis sp. ILAH1]|uniref:ABC transporter permease/M1 family aminopeptidase n=1 Tax=unclassified Nannocystis TaxID=2627009 RepID=UPI00226D956D|nr:MULTISPECIES: M1 family aminopeptidase [unclassified Nannocystis]MCY0992652.1 M1 family aminopeptidase [Nannocystis sp. ILAH1]MCY1070118.1 M1 family aminopeptidase [Nannocystis sp. RBIL2]